MAALPWPWEVGMHAGGEEVRVERYPLFTDCYRNLALKYQSLGMVLKGTDLGPAVQILRSGIVVPVTRGQSVWSWLTEDLCLPEGYVARRISTVILNHRPVDDLTSTALHSRDALDLSAAVPGLAGAVLRAGGQLAAFRRTISHRGAERRRTDGPAMISVRILNLLTGELGPPLLARGALVRGGRLVSALPEPGDMFWNRCASLRLNRQPIDPAALLATLEVERERSFLFRLLLGE